MGIRYRYRKWYIRFWKNHEEVLMATEALSKREAKSIEHMVKKAIRNWRFLRAESGLKRYMRSIFPKSEASGARSITSE